MRFSAAVLLWLIATVSLTLALPAAWAQLNLVDESGYAALAQRAAADPQLQSAVAGELTAYVSTLIVVRGQRIDGAAVRKVAADYTAGPGFAPQFVRANRIAHQWLFTTQSGSDRWVIDLAPMLDDTEFRQLLAGYGVQTPETAAIPVAVGSQGSLRRGRLASLAHWGPLLCRVLTIVTGVCALLTVVVAPRRDRAVVGLGISALLAGTVGWAGVAAGRGAVNDLMGRTAPAIRRIVDALVNQAIGDLHHWLIATLVVGAVLVTGGIALTQLPSIRHRNE